MTVPLGSAQEQLWEVNRAPGPLPSGLWLSVPQQGLAGALGRGREEAVREQVPGSSPGQVQGKGSLR